MTDMSSVDSTADEPADTETDWYRSPLVLVAGFLLFLGALALVVMGLTGGDDTASEAQVAASAPSETDSDTASQSTDDAASDDATDRPEREPAPALSFGGEGSAEIGPVVLNGDPLPRLVQGEDDTAVGTLAPEVTANSLANGNPIQLGPGRARVIGFFAHWCPHCQAELPEVTQWLAENQLPPNTEFIAVSTAVDEGRGNYPASAWFTDVGFNAPVVVDDADATLLSSYGFSGFPAFIAIDASGTVVARAGGNIGVEGLTDLFDNFAS